MAQATKVLGQANPAANALTDLYTPSGASSAVVSTIVICNQASTVGAFRISIAVAGAADALKQYIAYDALIAGNTTVPFTIGITLANTDVMRVQANSAFMSFSGFGVEVT